MTRGPVEFVVVEFPGQVPGRQLAPELQRLVDEGVISVVDVLFVNRGADGAVSSFELADRDGDGEFEALDPAVQEVDGLISEQDVAMVGEGLQPGSTAAVFLFEHAWLRRMREIVTGAGGQVVLAERIPGQVVEAVELLATAGVDSGAGAGGQAPSGPRR